MILSKATLSDLACVAPLFNQYRVFYGQPSDLDLAADFLEQRLTHHESVILLARNEQGDCVGFTQLYPSFSSVSVQRTWILNDLYVLPELRGQGVGKMLLNAARQHAIDSGAKGIGLETARDNLSAQKLYESLGYQRETEFYSYFLSVKG